MESNPLEEFTATFTTEHVPPSFGDPETEFIYSRSSLATSLKLIVPEASDHGLFAHRQWRAGLKMADYIADDIIDVKGQTVLEIGAGTALPGLVSVLKGSKQTVLTDYDDEKLLSFIRRNAQTCLADDDRKRCKVIGHIWGRDTEDLLEFTPNKFSLILCADVLWNAFSHPDLIKTLHAVLAPTSDSRIVVISGFHTGREPLARFLRLAAFKGLVPDEDGFIEREVATNQTRDWVEEGRDDGDIRNRNRWTLEGKLRFSDEVLAAFS